MDLNPYIAFNGDCEAALNFYKDCLGGEVTNVSRYEGSPMDVPDEYKQRVLHAEYRFGAGSLIMGCDTIPPNTIPSGQNISLSVCMKDLAQTESVFGKISDGGTVTMPLAKQFWGTTFGMVTDKFGINWLFNCENAKNEAES
jgi:PhnB protein